MRREKYASYRPVITVRRGSWVCHHCTLLLASTPMAATGLEEIGGEESAFVQEDVIAVIKEVSKAPSPRAASALSC